MDRRISVTLVAFVTAMACPAVASAGTCTIQCDDVGPAGAKLESFVAVPFQVLAGQVSSFMYTAAPGIDLPPANRAYATVSFAPNATAAQNCAVLGSALAAAAIDAFANVTSVGVTVSGATVALSFPGAAVAWESLFASTGIVGVSCAPDPGAVNWSGGEFITQMLDNQTIVPAGTVMTATLSDGVEGAVVVDAAAPASNVLQGVDGPLDTARPAPSLPLVGLDVPIGWGPLSGGASTGMTISRGFAPYSGIGAAVSGPPVHIPCPDGVCAPVPAGNPGLIAVALFCVGVGVAGRTRRVRSA